MEPNTEVRYSQPAAGCRIYDLETPATASPDWDTDHTDLEDRTMLGPDPDHGRGSTEPGQGVTFGVVSGVKLKEFDWVVGETVDIDPVLQDNDNPAERDRDSERRF